MDLGFPAWLRIQHLLNIILTIFLMRGGVGILADHPKLYWTDNTEAENYWIKFGKKQMPKDKLWTSLDEAETVNSVIALPGGHHNLGSSRRWHFLSAPLWILNGLIYYILLFATGEWRRLIPTSWDIFPRAIQTFKEYVTLHIPSASAFHPYDPLQQLSYAGIVFILAPLIILTGLAMAPSIEARFPWYLKLFGGKQWVRSIHFLCLVGMTLFIIVHTLLVLLVHFPENMGNMVFGSDTSNLGLAMVIGLLVILGIIILNVWATWYTLKDQRRLQLTVDTYFEPFIRGLFGKLESRQKYTKKDISPFFRVNGYPPKDKEFLEYAEKDFQGWTLKISGLVEKPIEISLGEIKKLPLEQQITKHNCIQGWTGVAQWGGVSLKNIIELSNVLPKAKYIVFYAYDRDENGKEYYSSLSLKEALMPQSILAYEMNYEPLPIVHGAPLRLRTESKLGFKMVKYIKSIEFVEDIRDVLGGRGGYREDIQHFDTVAAI